MNERLLSLYTAAGELEMQEIRTDRAKAALAQAVRKAMAADVPPHVAAKAVGMTVRELFKLIQASPSSIPGPGSEEDEVNWL